MQKWEYLTVGLWSEHPDNLEDHWFAVFENGVKIAVSSNFQSPTRSGFFNRYGEQGWELVCVNQVNLMGYYIFKRPKQ